MPPDPALFCERRSVRGYNSPRRAAVFCCHGQVAGDNGCVAKGPGDGDSVGDDLEVIKLVPDERKSTARKPEPRDKDRRLRRRRLLVLAIAAVVVAIAGVSVVVTRDDGDAEAGPANRGTSSASRTAPDVVSTSTTIPREVRLPPTTAGDASTTAPLLPEGAPSTPPVGELVASIAHPSFEDGVYLLYADGRLITWARQAGVGQAGVGGGFVEQRLTPEGVERVRSEFIASGQFAPNPPPGTVGDCSAGGVCVRGDDGRLHRVFLTGQVSAAEARLVSFLRTLDGSLPKTEWAAPRIRAYVASRFNVCVGTYADLPDRAIPVQIDLATVWPAFPTGAAELFGSREPIGGPPGPAPCFEVTLDEARALADVFLSSTGGGTHAYSGIVIRNAELATIQSDVSEGIVAFIQFQPLLPDGEPAQ
jgi:hypothetical protein